MRIFDNSAKAVVVISHDRVVVDNIITNQYYRGYYGRIMIIKPNILII
jgi:ATPase subunit of ABC transporter with duplicated ATPase domains